MCRAEPTWEADPADELTEVGMPGGRSNLRRTVDVLALGLCVVVASLVAIQQSRSDTVENVVTQTELSLSRFHSVLKVQATTSGVAVNGRGWPNTIEGNWFGDDPPRNHLLTGDRAWVEIAPVEDADRDHPVDPVAFDSLDFKPASFWYNPYRGVVRARVAPQINDQTTLALYNRVNGVFLTTLSPEGGLMSAERERDEAQRLREIAERVREMAESTGATRAPGNQVTVRRVEVPVGEPAAPGDPVDPLHEDDPDPVPLPEVPQDPTA
ncbi:MAG: hypothetical protein KIT54_11470 [Phycisphaeraceae bacterium]|nr:hypothetical protein [Phycisphaeraceae bacterium]